MKKLRRFLAFVLCAALCFLLLTGCGSRDTIRFKMIAELNQEEFCVAFRKGDPLCDIFTAALKELSADGQISRLSAQYLGTDYTCMEALPGALQLLETQPEPGRKLRIGVQDGIAPISSSRDDGSFGVKGVVTTAMDMLAERGEKIDYCWAIGPSIMMKFASLKAKELKIPCWVSLNPIMIDGTGMCGCCRVTVNDKIRFACVDGPEFDGWGVNWNEFMTRLRQYKDAEKISLEKYKSEVGE